MVAHILPTLLMEDPAAEFIPIRLPRLRLEHPSDPYVITGEVIGRRDLSANFLQGPLNIPKKSIYWEASFYSILVEDEGGLGGG
ncbi:hypothetical protein CRG98_019459 [Punica granatum]|uniref:Uncharacterized protein n=1 Tax=Punica granatum TaxID=22663 RepID=A0A2I0JUZ5_PUNGR|nr:hypothetical protein CRG98_019459 [Punica granatum]